jgi:hypothetical protein
MTSEEIEIIVNDLIEMYGDNLPDPEHCPTEFSYIVKLYNYCKNGVKDGSDQA